MEEKVFNKTRREKFGGGYYYSFCDNFEKGSMGEDLEKVKEEVDKIVNPPIYDRGLSCGFTYDEDKKLRQIREILNGGKYRSLAEYDKLVKIDNILKQDNSDAFYITSYSNKLDRLKIIVKEGLSKVPDKSVYKFSNDELLKKENREQFKSSLTKLPEFFDYESVEKSKYVFGKKDKETFETNVKNMSNRPSSRFGM